MNFELVIVMLEDCKIFNIPFLVTMLFVAVILLNKQYSQFKYANEIAAPFYRAVLLSKINESTMNYTGVSLLDSVYIEPPF